VSPTLLSMETNSAANPQKLEWGRKGPGRSFVARQVCNLASNEGDVFRWKTGWAKQLCRCAAVRADGPHDRHLQIGEAAGAGWDGRRGRAPLLLGRKARLFSFFPGFVGKMTQGGLLASLIAWVAAWVFNSSPLSTRDSGLGASR